jgi:hypothetical protein
MLLVLLSHGIICSTDRDCEICDFRMEDTGTKVDKVCYMISLMFYDVANSVRLDRDF